MPNVLLRQDLYSPNGVLWTFTLPAMDPRLTDCHLNKFPRFAAAFYYKHRHEASRTCGNNSHSYKCHVSNKPTYCLRTVSAPVWDSWLIAMQETSASSPCCGADRISGFVAVGVKLLQPLIQAKKVYPYFKLERLCFLSVWTCINVDKVIIDL